MLAKVALQREHADARPAPGPCDAAAGTRATGSVQPLRHSSRVTLAAVAHQPRMLDLGSRPACARRRCRAWRRPGPPTDLGQDGGVAVVGRGLARWRSARLAGSSLLKMPEPTNTPSAPSCIMSAASAGVAMPPAEKLTTGSLPFSATQRDQLVAAPAGPWRPR